MPNVRLVFSPRYEIGGAFPARKFGLASKMLEGRVPLVEPDLPPREALRLSHHEGWLSRVERSALTREEEEQAQLSVTPDVSLAHRLAAGGTLLAARDALEQGVGLHAGGGAHHAFAGHGGGYCLINDLACAGLVLLKEGRVRRLAVVDLDVHQGDGTASILAGEPRAFTLSLHQRDLYPEKKQRSTLDVELPAGTRDEDYLKLLRLSLSRALAFEPDLVLYQAGVDCAAGDLRGGLSLTKEGLLERDELVRDACAKKAIAVAVTLGGGYRKDVGETAGLHAQTLAAFARASQS